MVRNIFRDSDIVKFYFIRVILLYGSVMLILSWCYDYFFYITYIWIDKNYDSDDLPLIQMVLQRNSEVNDENEDVEDEEDGANFAEISDEGAN